MKQTLYSRILLILTGILLSIAAAFTYAAAIRVFPLFSFASGGGMTVHGEFASLRIPILALCAVALLLCHLYQLLSPRSAILLVACGILPIAGCYFSAEIDSYAATYLLPALVFYLYPTSLLSILFDRTGEAKPSAGKKTADKIASLALIPLLLVPTAICLLPHPLLVQLTLLVLTPILPLVLLVRLAVSAVSPPVSPFLRIPALLLMALLPLSACLRPFSYDASMLLARILLPILAGAVILSPVLPRLILAARKRLWRKEG